MITVRRAEDRRHHARPRRDVWRTFSGAPATSPMSGGFGALTRLDEELRAAGGGPARHRHRGVEILTYVRAGALAYDDSTGEVGVPRRAR